jgi:dTDP-4-amino-4,6-dideoxygalactose transaminase
MSNILAAIGRGQLRVLDERVKRKREIFDYYQNALGDVPGIEFITEAPYGRCNRWLTVILVTPEDFGADPSRIYRTYGAGREEVRLALEAENIEARPVWKPMHLQPVFGCRGQRPEIRSQKTKQRYAARVVGGSVAPQLNTLKGPGSTGQGGLCHNSKRRYPARAIGGRVAEDLFNRGVMFAPSEVGCALHGAGVGNGHV